MNAPLAAACALILAWLILVWITLIRPARQQRREAHKRFDAALPADGIAVLYASQGGTATELAQRTAQALGPRARAYPLADFTPQTLGNLQTALFIVSTYGEGDPPDVAHAFHQRALAWQAEESLNTLRFGLLALGDRTYQHFCGYGLQLENWLSQHGATALFDAVQVDRLDAAALREWQALLTTHLRAQPWQTVPPSRWRLAQRQCLNPGSQGAPCHELLLEYQALEHSSANPAELPGWQAGDVAQITIGDSGQQRDYSIASTPAEGHLRLLVRLHHHADGSPGLGSHWLSEGLKLGEEIKLHIRRNAQFHLPDDDRRAIFIGNGTGLAGLRALIQERKERGLKHNWLLFGERQRACDFFWQDVLQNWLADGTLSRLDLAFSRDQAEKHYVHHRLREAATTLRDWIARGAVLYICGNRSGMAHDVDQALQDILGAHGYQDLIARNGYRRDVY